MARQLKVFSTPAGFVNAVVAAPSQKAALEAWGLRENAFANGSATIVTDPELIARALETPGKIVRVPIGSAEAILEGVRRPVPVAPSGEGGSKPPKAAAKGQAREKAPPPPPERGPLTRAEEALSAAKARRAEELGRLDIELEELQARRKDREAALDKDVEDARSARVEAARRYRSAGGKG